MKQIIPFKKELLFKTKVSEITSISLEHTLTLKKDDLISGEFYVNGDYKMTEGSINREKFQFRLPFDITLDSRYDISSIMIDIDNFYYEIINNEALQVNIDVYVEGEKVIEEILEKEKIVSNIGDSLKEEKKEEVLSISENINSSYSEKIEVEEPIIDERGSSSSTDVIMPTSVHTDFEKVIEKPIIPTAILENRPASNSANEFNLFENMDGVDTYVTYYVYVVKEEDTLEKVLSKYEVSKEEVALYNNIENVTPGTKLIIPSHCNE